MFVGLRNLLLLSACLVLVMGQAWAVALGKIEVTSHLGETFYAEASLQLDAGEKISNVFVELATPSDYQILEVFRDPSINNLQVDIKNDLRGPRAVVSSTEAIDTPYFNLVLKLKHGHATNFKKYPVFLDLPEQVRPAVSAPRAAEQPFVASAPVERMRPDVGRPAVSAITIRPLKDTAPAMPSIFEPVDVERAKVQEPASGQPAAEPTGSQFAPYEGWARTSRYGPMVRGDSITTVARRLPVDERYSLNQIMAGLYNRNKDKFRENNINLINAGTYLDVPTADDIEALGDREAKRMLKQHEQRWKQLKNQPVYAAEAEAQKNRYRTRVRVGQTATGTAAAPVPSGRTPDMQPDAHAGDGAAVQLRALQEENLRLKQALQESEEKAAGAQPATADAAVAKESVKKLELTVARLQRQLKLVNQQLQEVKSQDMNALTYALSGIIVLLIAVAGYLLFLLRRDRPHPAMDMSGVNATPAADAQPGADIGGDSGGYEMDNEALAESLDAETDSADAVAQADDGLLFDKDETPALQAGVDYLAEAEVYLRYGMEDEALQQMKLAIEQKPDHLDAHRKLVQLLQGRGDKAVVAAAIETARSVLSAGDLEAFEASLDTSAGESVQSPADAGEPDASTDDALIMDAMPDMDVVAADAGGQEPVAGDQIEAAADEASSDPLADMDLDLSGIEVPELDTASGGVSETSEETVSESWVASEGDIAFDPGESVEQPKESDTADIAAPDNTDKTSVDLSLDEEDFVSAVQISSLAAQADGVEDEAADDAEGLDFTLNNSESLDADLEETLGALDTDEQTIADVGEKIETLLDSPEDSAGSASETVIETIAEDDEFGLDAIISELESSAGSDAESGFDLAAADEGSAIGLDTSDDAVPETVIDTAADVDMGLDEILSEYALEDESEASTDEGSAIGLDMSDEAVPETVIDTAAEVELDLDEILGEFDSFPDSSDAGAVTAGGPVTDATAVSDTTALPEMDVSDELDNLLAEWDTNTGDAPLEAGPESLDVDRARSLLAEGSVDEAEAALLAALDGDRRGDALIGLAEAAAKRGDNARKVELLAEAETLVDDRNRDWFDSVKNLSA